MGYIDYDAASYEQAMADDFLASVAAAEYDEYANRPWPVMCDICAAQDFASEKALRTKGWELGKGYEFCPSH